MVRAEGVRKSYGHFDALRGIDLEVATDDETEARSQVERMCEQLLANPLIESYTIQLEHG